MRGFSSIDGQLNFVFRDHLGSTRVVASADGQSGVGYSYDALGNVVQQSAFGTPTSAIAYQYTGQEFDSETGLHNFRARLYDSELFRFYATDPAGQFHSPYAFVGNSPLMMTDPTGMFGDPVVAPLLTVIAPTNPITAILAAAWTLFSTTVIAPMILQATTPVVQMPQSYPSLDYYRTSKEFSGKQMQLPDRIRTYYMKQITVRGDGIAPTIRPFEPNFFGSLAESGILGGLVYSTLNAPFVAGQVPFADNPRNLDGSVAFGNQLRDAGIGTLAATIPSANFGKSLTGVEKASQSLINKIASKRWLQIASEGSDEMRFLDFMNAEAAAEGANFILVRPNPGKAALLEEFLHGTQVKLGMLKGTESIQFMEWHVKDFMIRHKRMLGLGDEDVKLLEILKKMYE